MKKIFISTSFVLCLILSLSLASAGTLIAGKIYDSPNFETANAVGNANINVTCNSNLRTTQSLSDGTYSVTFNTTDCPDTSIVTVIAEKNGISNSGTGVVHDYNVIMEGLYIGVVNIALVPEFGLIVGALTIFGAIGVFFVIRKK